MIASKPSSKILLCTFFCVCGFLGNWYKVNLFFNVDFLLGSIFSMLAIVILGRVYGLIAALIAATCTYVLWNHPWAIIILMSEAVVVAWLYSKRKGNLVVYDLIYWICLGIPLIYFFYRQVMGLALQDVFVVMLKQSVNGISNTLLATITIIALKVLNKPAGTRIAYSELLFAVMLSFTLLPTIFLTVSAIREYQESRMKTLKSEVSSVSEAATNRLAGWITKHHNNVQILSSLVGDPNHSSFEEMQRYVEILAAASPDFKGMGVFDKNSVSVGYSPLSQDGKSTLGIDMSGRAHIAIMRNEKKPYITDMLMSKLGDPSPIAVLVAPVIISGDYKGYCSGVVETSQISAILANLKKPGVDITLIDRQNRVIVSTLAEFKTMSIFPRPYLAPEKTTPSQTHLWKPDAKPNTSVMQQWRGSFLFNMSPVTESSQWRVAAEASLLPVAVDISRYSLVWLSLQGLMILVSIVFSFLLSNRFITSMQRLQMLSRSVTQKLDDTARIEWPHSSIVEIDELSSNFERMTSALLKNISDRKINEKRITHINQLLDSIRLINKLIVYEKDRQSLLQRACNLLVEARGYRSAWAALHDNQGRLTVFAESGIGEDFNLLLSDIERGKMPTCYCQATKEKNSVVSIRDMTAYCSTCPLVAHHLNGAALVGTLSHNDRDYGLLTVALPAGMVDEENELSLFGELNGDLGYALYSLEQEEMRRQAEELYSLLFSSSADGILIADIETTKLRFANPAFCEFIGYSLDEILSRDVTAIFPQDSLPEILETFKRQAHEEKIVKTDIPCLRSDGSIVYADITAVPIVIEGTPCLAGFFRDITARKTAEQEKEKLENQLLQAQKMESVGRLAGGVAHDYNNMLSVILGYTEMALEEIDQDQPLHEKLKEVYNAAQRSAKITRQLLAFARKQTIDPVALNLNDTISRMLNMLQRLLGENIILSCNPKPELWYVKMDPSQIDQILANLCVNARDAIADVGRITIETDNTYLDEQYCANHADCTTGEYVMLAVSDTGCGIDEETMARIYEPYYTTKEIGNGTGLGMSTVYGIVKQNNGSINIYSEPGKGTTVKIYIPRHYSDPQDDTVESTLQIFTGNGETVLLVEDETSLRQMFKTMLERSGYSVITASTPSEAFAVANEHAGEIDLLFTDVVMPEMNGKEMADKLQTMFPTLKVLFMSGYTANAIAHHGVLDDNVNFIQKPFSYNNLTGKVNAVLSESNNKYC